MVSLTPPLMVSLSNHHGEAVEPIAIPPVMPAKAGIQRLIVSSFLKQITPTSPML